MSNTKTGNNFKLLLVVSMVVPLLLIWFSSRWLVAELKYLELEQWLKAYDDGSFTYEASEWEGIKKDLERIERLGTGSWRYSRQKGLFYLLNPDSSSYEIDFDQNGNEVFGPDAETMLSAYRLTTHRQPAWTYGWFDFFTAYNSFFIVNGEMVTAFERAMNTGPFIPVIQDNLVAYSLEFSYLLETDMELELTPEEQELKGLILLNLNRILSADAALATRSLRSVQSSDFLSVFCPHLAVSNLQPQIRDACEPFMINTAPPNPLQQ